MRRDFDRQWMALGQEVLLGIKEWRMQHPQATLKEIEVAVDEHLAVLRAGCIQSLLGYPGEVFATCDQYFPLVAEQGCASFGGQTCSFEVPGGARHFRPLNPQLFASALNGT